MMRVPQTTFSASCKDTDSLVIKFSKLISPNSIIYLNGDVGTGKTYFAKKLAEQFGIIYFWNNTMPILRERKNDNHTNFNALHTKWYYV